MNPFNLEDQYQFYLGKMKLQESTMHPTQRIQLREAFMGASGIILLLIRDEFGALSDDEGDAMFTSMVDQVGQYWKDRVAAFENPKPLRRLTEMTHEEFEEYFGKGYAPSFKDEKIASFTSLYGLHKCISQHGYFHSYQSMQVAGFDMTFTLDRKKQ